MTNPWIQKLCLSMQDVDTDHTDDVQRCLDALAAQGIEAEIPISVVQEYYEVLRMETFTVTVLKKACHWEVVRAEPGDTTLACYGAAVDLGSTTVVMRLVDFASGSVLAEDTVRNGQRAYGDEILSRIFYTKDNPEHRKELQTVTVETLNTLVDSVCAQAGILPEQICTMVISGNTTMIHFLLGLDTFCLFHTPFRPVVKHPGLVWGRELGLSIDGPVYCFPSTANYLGGDIISGLLATGLTQREETSLALYTATI